MKKLLYLGILTVAFSSILNGTLTAQQTYYYDFRNTLNEKNSLAPALNVLGTGAYIDESLPDLSCLSRAVYGFTTNSGVQFDNGAAANFIGTTFSIEMYFRFTSISGFSRIIDFKNRTSDFGVYVTSTEFLFYDNFSFGTAAFASNEYVHFVLTRDGVSEDVNMYLNGSFIGTFNDGLGDALLNGSNVLNFFQDDLVFGGEASPGNIALLRLHDFVLDATNVSDNFQNLEATSGVVSFRADVTTACLSTNVFNFTNESENTVGVTYSWEFGDGNTDTGINTSHSYSSAGIFNVLLIADDGLGCSDTASLSVSVTSAPTITPSGSVDLCTGGSVILSASVGASYLWSNGLTAQDISVTLPGDYYVTVDDGLGCIETSDTITVTKYSVMPGGINYFIGSTVACPGQSLPYEINMVNRAVFYTWTMPTGATSNGQSVYQTTANSIVVDYDGGFVGGNIEVTAHNGCGVRGPLAKTVNNSPPLTPSPITGTSVACGGNTYPYSVILRPGVDTYTWSAPVGSIITGQGSNVVDITFPIGFTIGPVSVVASNSCGSSNIRSLLVRSNPPNPGNITGPVSALCNTIQTYSVPLSPFIDTFNWTPPSGSTLISGQGTNIVEISFNPGLVTGYVRVTGTNACGTSGIKRLAIIGGVEISDNPADAGVCSGDSISFSVAAPGAGLIFQWRKDGINLVDNATISGSTTATLTIDPVSASDAGLYDCIVRRSCGTADTSDAATLIIDGGPPQPGIVTGPGVACDGDVGVVYSFAPVGGATSYNWSANTGVTITSGQTTNSIVVDFGPTPNSGYEFYVTALNGCGESDTTLFWVRTKVSTPNFTIAPTTVCANTSNVLYELTSIVGASSYNWIVPANTTIASGQGTTSATIDFGPGFTSGEICVTASNICFTTPQRCRNITSTPNFPGGINGQGTNVCNSTQIYNINPVTNATLYNWTIATGATITAGQGTNSVTVDFGPSFSSGNITVSTENSCGTSNPRSRLIYGTPAKPTAIFGNASPCANSIGNIYSIDPLPGATSYTWTVPIGATITAGATTNSITVDFGPNGGGIYARGNNACGSGAAGGLLITFSCRQADIENYPFHFSIFPNPANEIIYLTIDKASNSTAEIMITDLSGRIVVMEKVSGVNQNESIQLDISNLSAGVYVVKVSTELGTSFTRFVRD